ncbi:TonB family protein, partial [Leisingera sp. ANG-Vp]|uniref:TonB family protein n=1 Tax=Leisingera sp. ANG-Vp TaxID=1577896 RepID=UPI0019D3C091
PAAAAPAPAPAPSADSVQERAVGSSQRQAKGDGGADAATTGESSRTASLKTRWGAAILSRVERHKRQPRGGGKGRVRIRLEISTQGKLVAASVARSSGIAALDQAALAAARKARYPRAPKALAPGAYSFVFSARFEG